MKASEIKILFVCLGNICRSPTAQAVFQKEVNLAGLQKHILVDSCGTAGYHIGEAPDPRAISAAENRGYKIAHLRSRKINLKDFEVFDYILAMDRKNLSDIFILCPKNSPCNISLFLDFEGHGKLADVPDPYYGGEEDFENVLNLLETASKDFMSFLKHNRF